MAVKHVDAAKDAFSVWLTIFVVFILYTIKHLFHEYHYSITLWIQNDVTVVANYEPELNKY